MSSSAGGETPMIPGDQGIEADLFELERYINDIWEFLPIPIIYLSPIGVILDVNKKFIDLCKRSKNELVGTLIGDLCPAFREEHYQELIASGKQIRRLESTIVCAGSSKVPVSIYAYARKDQPGTIIGCFAACIDITERKHQEALLIKSETEYRTTLNSMLDAIHVIDADFRIIMFNDTLRKWNQELDLTADILGKNLFEVFSFLSEAVRDEYRHVFETGKMLFTEEATRVGGKEFITDTRKIPVIEDGKVVKIITEIRDVTENKKTQNALKSSEERFRIAAQSASDLIWDWDLASGRLEWFGTIDALVGYEQNEFPRTLQAWENIIHPADHDRVMQEVEKHLRAGEPYNTEYRIVRKDGTIRHWTDRGTALRDASRKAYRMVGACADITERKYAEQRILVANERLKFLLSSTTAVVYTSQVTGDYGATFVSENVQQILGYEPREFTATSNFWLEHVHPDDRERILAEIHYVVELGSYAYDYRFQRRDGHYIWMRDEMRLVRDSHGEPMEIVGLMIDITERKIAEEALLKSERKYRQLVELTLEGVWAIDAESNTTFVNPRMAMMLGYQPQEMMGKSLFDFIDGKALERTQNLIERRKHGITEQHEFEFITKNGSRIHTLMETAPILGEEGKYLGAIAVVTNITERVKAERALKYHLEFEKIVTTISTQFINIMSEEIDAAVDNALLAIGQFAGASRSYVFLFSADGSTMSNTHEWCADGIEAQMHRLQDIPLTTFPWILERLRRLETIVVPRVADLPPEARAEKEEFDYELIKSIVLVPMVFGGHVIGFVGFDAVAEEKQWTDDTVTILRVVGEIFTNAVERRFVFEALSESEEKFRMLAEKSPNMIFIYHKGAVVYGNEKCSEILGYSKDEFYDPNFDFMCLIAPEDKARIQENLARHSKGEEIEPYDYTLVCKDGKRIDAILTTKIIPLAGKQAIMGIITDITERKKVEQDVKDNYEKLKKALDGTVISLAAAAEKKDPYTAGHQRRVTHLAIAIAKHMGFDDNAIDGIRVGGTLHDIGKIYVPTEILSKPTKLTSVEYSIVKTHPQIAADIIKNVEFPWPVVDMILQHHERINGSGYPAGLNGDQIIPEARILIVADVVEAMSSHRPYRPAKGIEQALEEITQNRGTLYDSAVVDACLAIFASGHFNFE